MKNITQIIFSSALLVAAFSQAQAGEVTGTVKWETRAPIASTADSSKAKWSTGDFNGNGEVDVKD